MPEIWNVNGNYNVNSKRIHKKLLFEIGESFSARIMSLDEETREAILKLLDGWQFSAEIKDKIDFTPNKLIRFEVEGYEQGKIILKVLGEEKVEVKESSLLDTLREQGINLKKEDYVMLEKMVKHNMPLNKENISKMKSLLDFQHKIIENPSEEEIFISRYLNNKVIDIGEQKGKDIQKILKGFFKEFKSLNIDELFTLIENDIELTEKNIKSFNRINKESAVIYKGLIDLDKSLFKENESSIIAAPNHKNNLEIITKDLETSVLKYLENKNIDISSENGKAAQRLLKELFYKLDEPNRKVLTSMLEKNIDFSLDSIKSFNNIDKEALDIFKALINIGQDNSDISPKSLEDQNAYSYKDPKEVMENTEDLLEINMDNGSSPNFKEVQLGSRKILKSIDNFSVGSKDISGKEILKRLLDLDSEEVESKPIIKEQDISDKVSNKSLETSNNIKEELSNKADNANDKVLKTSHDIKEELSSKTDNPRSKTLEISHDIKEELNSKTDNINNKVLEISHDIKEELNSKIGEMKDIIKRFIEENNNGKSENFNKILQSLQSKANDFKVFNSISNQYYYLDVPVKFNNEEYPCKLIIKDDRKNGKKIDSSNVKFVVSVKTINMGVVDAYIKVFNSNINVDINCEESCTKILELGKEKLWRKLSDIGYNVSIQVKKKHKEVDLVECRDFFEDSEFTRINLMA